MSGRWLLPTLMAVALVVLFSALGVWQLRRADEKRVLQAQYDRRAVEAPLILHARVEPLTTLNFHRVTARGIYDRDFQVLVDNRIHQGMPGYHVLTPLRIDGSETRVLINRGWVPLGVTRAQLPAVDPPVDEVTVTGIAAVPHEGLSLGTPPPLDRTHPTVWAQFDLQRYSAAVPFPLQPIVILLDPQSDAGGFVRAWARLDAGIAVHQGYAFQWFMLAVTVVVTYIVLIVRSRRRKMHGD